MIVYILRRLVATIPVIFLTSVIVFLLMRILPGDPVTMIIGQAHVDVSAETIEQLRHEHGLDQPVYVQYVQWVKRGLTGDFGRSFQSRQPVWEILRPRILPTLHIGLTGWVLAMLMAIPVGAITAMHPNSWKDWLGTVFALVGAAMPYFLISGLLIYFVALRWGWLPASGYVSLLVDPWESIKTSILPAITLSLGFAAVIARQTRSSFADVLQHPYIRTARAKGLSQSAVMLRHAFKNAMLPVVTILGIQLGSLFSGAIITETIFAIPGIGRLLVNAILSRDYAVVQVVVLFITFAVVFANFAVDVAYGFLDPRTRQR